MFDELRSAVASLEAVLRDFEPGVLDARHAVRAVKLFARVEHLGAAGKALAAGRVDATRAYRESGARSAGHWLANTTGVPVASAFRALETVGALDGLPVTAAAFRAGELSEAQAHEITGAARKDPAAEAELVAEAKRGRGMKGLKDRCRNVRAGAESDDKAWAKRLHDGRELRRWVDADSAPCGMWRFSPDKGAEVDAALDAEIDLIIREARATGGSESRDGLLLPEYSSDSRYRPQWLDDWLEQRYPVCGQPDCDADFHLQTDHVLALSDGGRTEQDNLWRLCWHHHDLKTNHGWRAFGPPHEWQLVPPGLPDAPDDPDPP